MAVAFLLSFFGLFALCAAPLVRGARAQDPGPEKVLTIDDAEHLAMLNNATLLAAEQDVIIAQQRVQEAIYQFFPEIGVQASGTRYAARYPFALAPEFRSVLLFQSPLDYIYSGRAYFTQELYSGGRHVNLLHLAQSALKQAQTRHDAAKMDVAYGVKTVFYQLILAQDEAAASAERLKSAQAVLGRPLGGWERVEAQALVDSLRAKQAEAAQAVELARLNFRKELNLELDAPVQVSGKLDASRVSIDLDRAIVWAMELRPELQSQIYKARMDDIAVNLALGRRIPTVVLAGDYELTAQKFPLNQNNWDATIGVRLPFSFDFWSQIREKRAEKRHGEITRSDLQDKVRLEVRQAHIQLESWQREWPLREQEYLRLKTLAQSVKADAHTGLPYLRAQIALLEAQERYLTALKEDILARARLERAVGRPIAD